MCQQTPSRPTPTYTRLTPAHHAFQQYHICLVTWPMSPAHRRRSTIAKPSTQHKWKRGRSLTSRGLFRRCRDKAKRLLVFFKFLRFFWRTRCVCQVVLAHKFFQLLLQEGFVTVIGHNGYSSAIVQQYRLHPTAGIRRKVYDHVGIEDAHHLHPQLRVLLVWEGHHFFFWHARFILAGLGHVFVVIEFGCILAPRGLPKGEAKSSTSC